MAAISIKFATINPISMIDGKVHVAYDDGSGNDFETFAEFEAFARQQLDNIGVEGLKAIAIIHLMTLDPLLDSPTLWAGKTFTLDPEKSDFTQVLKKV